MTDAVREIITGEITLSPNPAINFLNVQLPETSFDPKEISLFDMQGKHIDFQHLSDGQNLDVQLLAAGVYTVKVVVKDRIYVGRFVKR